MYIKDATELQAGDRIVTADGIKTVRAASTPGRYHTVTIHTQSCDLTTTLPCPVKIVEE